MIRSTDCFHRGARLRWAGRGALGALIVALLPSCGGGGGDPGTPSTIPIEIFATETGDTDGIGLAVASDRYIVGDDATDVDYRGLIRIPLAQIPPGSNIVGAFLHVSFLQRFGSPAGNQVNNLGHLQFIRIDGSTPLDASDYGAQQLALDPANNLTVDFPNLRPRIGLLQPLLSAVAAGDTHLKIKMQYQTATNANGVADFMEFASTMPPPGHLAPMLEVIVQQ